MALSKINYVDNQTIITAQNLNDIQNEIIQNAQNLNDIQNKIIQNAKSIQKIAPRNLLDNSDFRSPVNQKGKTSYLGVGCTIDRWLNSSDVCKLTVKDGYIHMQNNPDSTSTSTQYIYQKIENSSLLAEKKFTIAARVKGNCRTWIQVIGQSAPDYYNYQDWTTIIQTVDIQLIDSNNITILI